MADLITWTLVVQAAPIWYEVVRNFIGDRAFDAGNALIRDAVKDGARKGVVSAVDSLRDPSGKDFNEAFKRASESFLARYELDRKLAQVVIMMLQHAQEKHLGEMNRELLMATLFSDKPRLAPIERYCHRAIAFDQIVAKEADTYTIIEVSRAFKYFFEELQRELMLSEIWRKDVIQFRSLQLQAQIAGEFDPLEMRSEYLAYLRDRYQFLDLKGFSPRISGRILSLRLAEVFTDLQLEEGRPYVSEYAETELTTISQEKFFELDWQRQMDLLEKHYVKLEATRPKIQLLKLADVLGSRRLVILGDPGSGKTTLTGYITLMMASDLTSHWSDSVKGLLPILVRVANYGRALEKDPTLHLFEYICQELTSSFGQLLRQELDYGQCLVILDGLDEVAEVGKRQSVAERIEDMVASYGNNRFLITSRPIGYQRAQLASEFRHVTIRPLSDSNQEQFVRLWHKEIRARGAGESEGSRWFEETDSLIKVLRAKPNVARLANNPLLLTIIVLMHWRGTRLPDRRVDIYASATETLIENWPLRQRGIDLDLEQIKSILAPIALSILRSSVSGVIAERNLVPLLRSVVQDVHGGSRSEIRILCDRLLQDLNEHSGIFLERGRDEFDYPVYGFLHQTFGEYLAALALTEDWNVGELKLEAYVHKARWREVVLLLAGTIGVQGRAVASRFVSEILALSSPFEDILHRDLLLVLECLGDDVRIKPDLRNEVLLKSVQLLASEIPDLRHEALKKLKGLKGTDHEAKAIELLRLLLQDAIGGSSSDLRDEARLLAAEALCELGDIDTAKPVVWKISEDFSSFGSVTSKTQGAVTNLRIQYWTHESLEWLANLFCIDRTQRPRLMVGADVSETLVRTVDGTDIPIFSYLDEDQLTALLEILQKRVTDEDVLDRVAWASIQRNPSVNLHNLLGMLDPEVDRRVCFLAACQLIASEHRSDGVAALQRLSQGVDNHALAAIEKLLELDEIVTDSGTLRRLATFVSSEESIDLARKLIEMGEESLGIAVILLRAAQEDEPAIQWEAAENLLEIGYKDLGLAAAKFIALTPGHMYRYEATEALMDSRRETGQFDEIIDILTDLAYDSYALDQERTIARLATLGETNGIAPILSRLLRGGDGTEQYRLARALVLGGMSEIWQEGSLEAMSAHRIRRLPAKKQAYLDSRASFLTLALDTISKHRDLRSWGVIQGIRANIVCEDGRPVQANELLDRMNESYADNEDAILFAAQVLLKLGYPDKSLVALNRLLNLAQVSPGIIGFASRLLLKMSIPEQCDYLCEMLERTDDSQVLIEIIEGAWQSDICVVPQLLNVLRLNSNDHRVKEAVIGQLGKVDSNEVRDVLRQALCDDTASVRASAANALGTLASQDFLEDLIYALGDADDRVRIAASQAINSMNALVPAEVVGAILFNETSFEVQSRLVGTMSRTEPDTARPLLLGALSSEADYVREAALDSLVSLEGSAVVPLLKQLISDETTPIETKAQIIRTLARYSDESICEFLQSCINCLSGEAYVATIFGLGIQGEMQVASELSKIVEKSQTVTEIVAAIEALGRIHDVGTAPAMADALKHPHEDVRTAAAQVLSVLLPGAEASQLLSSHYAMEISGKVRNAIVSGLSWCDPSTARIVLPNALLDESREVRVTAATVLGLIGDESCVPALRCCIYDSDVQVRTAAIEALGHLAHDSSREDLHLALRHQQDYVRGKAAISLAMMSDYSVVDEIRRLVLDQSINASQGCLALSYLPDVGSTEALVEILRYGRSKSAAAHCLARTSPDSLLKLIDEPFITQSLGLEKAMLRAIALHYAGNTKSASEQYQRTPEFLLATNGNHWMKSNALVNGVISSFELGYHQECVDLLRLASERDPKDEMIRSNLGIVYRIMREYELSWSSYMESLAIVPFGSIEVWNGLGMLSYARDQDDLAVRHFHRSLQLTFFSQHGSVFKNYWSDPHSIHMRIVALVGGGLGFLALSKITQVLHVLKWNPGVLTEILWDLELFEDVAPSLPGLTELLSTLRTIHLNLSEFRRGPLNVSW